MWLYVCFLSFKGPYQKKKKKVPTTHRLCLHLIIKSIQLLRLSQKLTQCIGLKGT